MDSGLADVSKLLASMPPVPPMPQTLSQRLEAAIANEAAQRATRMAVPGSGLARSSAVDRGLLAIPGRPELPDRVPRQVRRPRVGRWSAPLLLRGLAAAGVRVIVVGGGILLANERPTGGASRAAPALRPNLARPPGAAIGSATTTQLRYRHGAGYLYADTVTSNVNYTSADLASGVRRAAENSAQVTNPSMAGPSMAGPSAGAGARAGALVHGQRLLGFHIGQLESCLSAVTASSLVLLVDVARYQGQPAAIIVIRPASGLFHVIVVGLACDATNQDILTRLAVPVR